MYSGGSWHALSHVLSREIEGNGEVWVRGSGLCNQGYVIRERVVTGMSGTCRGCVHYVTRGVGVMWRACGS